MHTGKRFFLSEHVSPGIRIVTASTCVTESTIDLLFQKISSRRFSRMCSGVRYMNALISMWLRHEVPNQQDTY